MPRKPPPKPQDLALRPDQIRQGIERLGRRIVELEEFDPTKITKRWGHETKTIETAIEETLSRVFGEGTPTFERYRVAATLDNGPMIMGKDDHPSEIQEWLREGQEQSLSLLKQAVRSLEEDLADRIPEETSHQVQATPLAPNNDDIFIVHGRDEAAKEQVASVIRRAGLNPVILHQQANGGATVIEKFEKHGGEVGFAVVIATPDDVGGLVGETQRPRARQNVVGEMFWFAGRLGRKRVCALVKGDVEMPSDVAGIVYTAMDDHGGWKAKLLQELAAGGYKNLNWPEALK